VAIGDSGNVAPCHSFDTITIDGVTSAINVTLPAEHFLSFTTSNWTGSGAQWQLDESPTSASSGSPSTQSIDVDTDLVQAGSAGGSGDPGGNGGNTAGTGDLDSFNFDGSSSAPVGLIAVGTPSVSSTQSHTTANSAHFGSGNNYYTDSINPTNQIYTRQYIYINAENLANSDGFLRFYHGGAEMFVYFWNTSGFLSYFDSASSASITAQASAFPTAGWHLVETYTKISPTAGHVTVKVDGTQVYDSDRLGRVPRQRGLRRHQLDRPDLVPTEFGILKSRIMNNP
jgi:hypothetical protein